VDADYLHPDSAIKIGLAFPVIEAGVCAFGKDAGRGVREAVAFFQSVYAGGPTDAGMAGTALGVRLTLTMLTEHRDR